MCPHYFINSNKEGRSYHTNIPPKKTGIILFQRKIMPNKIILNKKMPFKKAGHKKMPRQIVRPTTTAENAPSPEIVEFIIQNFAIIV